MYGVTGKAETIREMIGKKGTLNLHEIPWSLRPSPITERLKHGQEGIVEEETMDFILFYCERKGAKTIGLRFCVLIRL